MTINFLFDSQTYVYTSRINRTPVGSDDGSTRRDPKSGVLTTDLKKVTNAAAEDAYDERDSGTGDSKKSNDAEYEEGIPLMMEGDNGAALFPPSNPSPVEQPQQKRPSPDLLVQVRHGGGESRISLTEFGDIPFGEDDESSPGSVVSGSSSDDQGGGEGRCEQDEAEEEGPRETAVDSTSSSSSSSSNEADTTTATSVTAKSESSKPVDVQGLQISTKTHTLNILKLGHSDFFDINVPGFFLKF